MEIPGKYPASFYSGRSYYSFDIKSEYSVNLYLKKRLGREDKLLTLTKICKKVLAKKMTRYKT